MRLLVWGLGYVGTVSAACFARLGHDVLGIEPNETKVEAVNKGHSAIKEPGLHDLVKQAVKAGQLCATTNGQAFIAQADVSLICVGTPLRLAAIPRFLPEPHHPTQITMECRIPGS